MAYQFDTFIKTTGEVVEWLIKEYLSVRTGRATPTLLDSVQVESYGAKVPIEQVGSIGVEDPRTLRISPWDKSQVRAIEKGIVDADLGLSVVTDDKGLRVIFPELTADRREQLLKVAKAKLEDARISVRKVRDESVRDIEAKEKDGGMGEDEKFRLKGELQKKVDEVNKKLEDLYFKKESEIKL